MLPPLSEDTFNYEDGNGNASNHSANPKSGRAGCAGAVRHLKDIEHGLRADPLYAVIPYFTFQSFKAEEPRPAVAQVQVTYLESDSFRTTPSHA